jgi:hypothetical protein
MAYRQQQTQAQYERQQREQRQHEEAVAATKRWVGEVLAFNDLCNGDAFIEAVYARITKDHSHDFGTSNGSAYILEAARALRIGPDEDLWSEVFRDHPHIQQGPLRRLVIANAFQNGVVWRGAAKYKVILEGILTDARYTDYILPTPEAKARQDAANHRAKLISRITENGTRKTVPVWHPQQGQLRYANSSTLESEPTERLELLAESVPRLRAQLAGQPVETPGTQSTPKDSLGDGTRLNRGQQAYDVSEAALPNNPATNAPYTRRDIKQASKQELQRLLFPPGKPEIWKARQAAVNAILDGRS